MGPAVWVIVPTYQEASSIERLLRRVTAVLADACSGDHRVLVVDDGSPDGTADIAERIGSDLGVVEVLRRREKDGLGRAYLAGFRHALDRGAELLVEMDADLSHDPDRLPALLAAAEEADVVLGSRYVAGGDVVDWSAARRLISRGGSAYARLVLRLPIRDLTGGYKVLRREVLEVIDFDAVRGQGYVFQIEMTYRATRAGFRVVEVPIVFRDRTEGDSKMSWRIAAEAIWRVPQLRRLVPAGAPARRAEPPQPALRR